MIKNTLLRQRIRAIIQKLDSIGESRARCATFLITDALIFSPQYRAVYKLTVLAECHVTDSPSEATG